MKKIGYDIVVCKNSIDVKNFGNKYLSVHRDIECVIDTYSKFSRLGYKKRQELFDLVAKYATTPIEEREEPKKYYLRLPNTQKTDYESYLNYNLKDETYFIGDETNIERFKTEFTEEEIDNLPEQVFIKTLIKEEVK